MELAARKVRIDQITVSKYAPPKLEVTVVCGSGVYIRSIARDLGESLGCGALMSALVRTGIGDFQLETSVPLDELQSMEDVRRALQPPRTAASQLPQLEADEAQLKALHHGQMISADVTTDQEYAVVDASSRLRSIAIGIPGGQLRASVNLP